MGHIQRQEDDEGRTELFDALGKNLRSEFDEIEQQRRSYEYLWLKDLRQYIGVYDPEVYQNLSPEQARTYVPMTRKKVRMADARLRDLLFPAGRRGDNWSITPTGDPALSLQDERRIEAQLIRAANQQRAQQAEQQGAVPSQIQPATSADISDDDREQAKHEFAKQAADRMRETMSDQLREIDYPEKAQDVLHSGHLYGIGVLKGPLPEQRVVPAWRFDAQQGWVRAQETDNRPFAEFRPLWSLYPDLTASKIDDARFIYEEHLFPKHQVLGLVDQHGFDADKIAEYLLQYPEGDAEEKTHEQQLRMIHDDQQQAPRMKGYYRLLSREGFIDASELVEAGLEDREQMRQAGFAETDSQGQEVTDEAGNVKVVGEVFASIWMIGSLVVKATISPNYSHLGELYHFYYCEKGDGNLFDAQGWPRIIRDDQLMLNAATRAMLDNARTTAGPQVEIEEGLLEGQHDPSIQPWKAWWRNPGAVNTNRSAITLHNIPNLTGQFGEIIQLAERWVHEHSMPAFMEGQSSPQTGNAQDTARGLSMLMSAANIELKDLARNFDEGVTTPFITALYDWNMIWSSDGSIKGAFEVTARGSTALIAKEVQAQQAERFLTFMQSFPDWVKPEEIVSDIGEVTEHAEAVKSKAEHDRDAQNQPPQPEQIEAQASRMKAEADLEDARARREEAEVQRTQAQAEHAQTAAQAAHEIALAMSNAGSAEELEQFANRMGVDIDAVQQQATGSEAAGAQDAGGAPPDAAGAGAGDVSTGRAPAGPATPGARRRQRQPAGGAG